MFYENYWVGLVTKDSPSGFGEDYREYVTVPKNLPDWDKWHKIHEAVIRWASAVTRWEDGSSILVRKLEDSWFEN